MKTILLITYIASVIIAFCGIYLDYKMQKKDATIYGLVHHLDYFMTALLVMFCPILNTLVGSVLVIMYFWDKIKDIKI